MGGFRHETGVRSGKLRGLPVRRVIVSALVALLLLAVVGTVVYFIDYYHASPECNEALADGSHVDVTPRDDCILFEPDNPVCGLVFYPGAKVQAESYAPLMSACAERDVLCVLVKMPFNFALFKKDAAKEYTNGELFEGPWYVGGHSLGGVAAASYASAHAEELDGIVLLAAYSADDLSATKLSALSVYGSNDNVLNKDAYEDNKRLLPVEFTELVIDGGNHAGFGCYGAQEGDGEATIPTKEQQRQTAEALAAFCR